MTNARLARSCMHDLTNLSVADLAALSRAVAGTTHGAASMEGCAQKIVRLLYDRLVLPDGGQACVLVRFFKTHSLGDLDPELRAVATEAIAESGEAQPGLKCLTLLATAGARPEWNSRHQSNGHKTIPLPSVRLVEQFPMISQVIRQLGFKISEIVQPDSAIAAEMEARGSNVFFVPDAVGSPHIPAQQEFVVPNGVRSVVGFGDVLPSGNMFVVVLFTRAQLSRERAEALNILSVGVKAAVLRYDYGTVFETEPRS